MLFAELYKALEKGYKVLDVAEVYHYDVKETYDGQDDNTGLFTKYIDSFLKSKQEASGWPSWCKSEADKTLYLQRYADHEGILLDRDMIERNEGRRCLSKLCLNSFWWVPRLIMHRSDN